ncbi:hypothetical protein CH35J_000805 [Colletotrichum higginsianum]|nr:hypothetical protein CH35J_000805 [Colletotrichum higginsianum]
MCYRVHTHTMSCDVRPVITSTKTLYANPYEATPSCPCNPSSRGHHHLTSSSRLCPSHGCCSLDVAIYRCPRKCRRPTDYHRYVCKHDPEPQSPSSSRSRRRSVSRSRSSYSYPNRHPSKAPSDHFKDTVHMPWRSLRTFDRKPDFHAAESSDFRFAVSELLDIGRILLHAESELEKAGLRIKRERTRHQRSHGAACERVLREWECSWTRRIEEMVVDIDDLKLSTEVLADCWIKYVGLLRKYELLGQRRVGGIVEGRGRRRRRSENSSEEARKNETDKPWRYFRRESWDRVDRRRGGRPKVTRGHERGAEHEPVRRRERRQSVRFVDEVERQRNRRGPSDDKGHRSWWKF